MTLESKVWRVDSDRLTQIEPSRLDEERRLEDWLCHDIGLLSDKLLLIGRQIDVSGGAIDLLAVDEEANLVVVELKRDRTPRDVVAQTLDYASSIQDLGRQEVERHARDFLRKEFDEAFEQRFGREAPEVVNGRQRMYIVASSLDSATRRIVEYLSRVHGVDINAATFSYFNTEQGEFLVRSTLLDEDEVKAKRRPIASEEELREKAVQCGVAKLWDIAISGFGRLAKKNRTQSTLYFQKRLDEGDRAVLSVIPGMSSDERGLAVVVVFDHLARAFGIDESKLKEVCEPPAKEIFPSSYAEADNNYYLRREQLESLIGLLGDERPQ